MEKAEFGAMRFALSVLRNGKLEEIILLLNSCCIQISKADGENLFLFGVVVIYKL